MGDWVIGVYRAGVAELADALDSGSSGRKAVQVQVLSPAPFFLPGGFSVSCEEFAGLFLFASCGGKVFVRISGYPGKYVYFG